LHNIFINGLKAGFIASQEVKVWLAKWGRGEQKAVVAGLLREWGVQTLLRLPSRKAGRGVSGGPMRRERRSFSDSFEGKSPQQMALKRLLFG